MRLVKCMNCNGTGWASPPRADRELCRECGGEGEVDENHAWAGYEAIYSYCGKGASCPLPR
jgi:DnaJ-class molecular chaperone